MIRRHRPNPNSPWMAISRVLMDPRLQYVLIIASALGFAALLFSGFLLFRYNDANDLLRRGKQQMAEGKIALAAQTFQQLVQKDPDHYEGHIRLGQAYLELDEKRKAEQEFKLATLLKTEAGGKTLNGRMDEVLASIAMSKLSVARGQYDEAQARLVGLWKTHSNHPKLKEALFELYANWGGDLQSEEKQWPQAIAAYKKALPYAMNYPLEAQIKERIVSIQQQQANILLTKNPKDPKALALLKDTLYYQYSVDMLIRVADLYEQQGNLAEALAWTRKAFDVNPENMSLKYTDLLIREGRRLMDTGNADQARAYFEEAEKIGKQAHLGLDQLYPVYMTNVTVVPTKPDFDEESFIPECRFLLTNKADKDLAFLLVKAVFYAGDKVLATVIEPVIKPEKPLSAYNPDQPKDSQRTIALPTEEALRLEQLARGNGLTVRLYVAYSEGESKTWQLKTLKELRIKMPDRPKTKEELEAEAEAKKELEFQARELRRDRMMRNGPAPDGGLRPLEGVTISPETGEPADSPPTDRRTNAREEGPKADSSTERLSQSPTRRESSVSPEPTTNRSAPRSPRQSPPSPAVTKPVASPPAVAPGGAPVPQGAPVPPPAG
jgi:tetratricopeptide (TPR) repeat protein